MTHALTIMPKDEAEAQRVISALEALGVEIAETQITVAVVEGSGEIQERSQPFCNFCGKKQQEVKRLIAGPPVSYICDECVDLCVEIKRDD
jgi:hypothetical protein